MVLNQALTILQAKLFQVAFNSFDKNKMKWEISSKKIAHTKIKIPFNSDINNQLIH